MTNTAKNIPAFSQTCGSKVFPELFQPGQIQLSIPTQRSALVPSRPLYVFDKDKLSIALSWMFSQDLQQTLRLWGPSGSGKTEFVYALGDRLGMPVYPVPIHSGLLPSDALVSKELVSSEKGVITKDRLLPLAQAYLEGGIVLLDEIDHANEAMQSFMQTLLDGKPLSIPEAGIVIKKHPNCFIFATSNTPGEGGSAQYVSANKENEAFRQRFSYLFFDYLQPSEEVKVLKQVWPDLPTKLAAKLVSFAGNVRAVSDEEASNKDLDKQYDGERISAKLSTRVLVALIQWMKARYKAPFDSTFELAARGACSAEAWPTVKEMLFSEFGDEIKKSPEELLAAFKAKK